MITPNMTIEVMIDKMIQARKAATHIQPGINLDKMVMVGNVLFR